MEVACIVSLFLSGNDYGRKRAEKRGKYAKNMMLFASFRYFMCTDEVRAHE